MSQNPNDPLGVGIAANSNNANPPAGGENNNPPAAGQAPVPAAGAQGAPAAAAQAAPAAAIEEEKKEEAKLSALEANALVDRRPQLVRSNLLPNNDRYILEQEHMQSLKAGSGIFGTSLVDLEDLKRQVLDIAPEQRLQKNKEMLKNLSLDGIYVDDADVQQKFTDINVQKLEERLLKNGQAEFFKMNGELKLNNDILDDDLTRPADLAFEQTTAFQTKEINAILSDRLHSFKKRYFRLDIILGNVKLFNCKNHLSEEEKLAIKLKEEFQDYETRISLCMIPFYMDRLLFIQQELERKQQEGGHNLEEVNFLIKTKEEVDRSLAKEKLEVNKMANSMYSLWTRILQERENKKFVSTNVELKVHETREDNGEVDQMLDLKYDGKKNADKDMPSSERSRQAKVKKLQVYAVLLINGRKVSKTNKATINWPNFVFQMKEMFQVHVFTIPSSIKVEIILCDGFSEITIDVVNVEVPGQHVKALTCSCPLIQKLPFSKVAYERRKTHKKYVDQSKKPDDKLTDAQKNKLKLEQEKKDKQEAMKNENDILGEMFVKAEWKGSGPKMPPIRSENLFKKEKLHKNRKMYTSEQEYMMLLKQLYVDVNDPRNQQIIKVLRETKNEFLVNLLNADSKNMMAEAKPFRHKLLMARQKDAASFRNVFIPMLESEVIDSTKSNFYLKELEDLFRNEAYLIHLQKMVNKQKEAEEEGQSDDLNSLFNLMDMDSLRRRQLIFDHIKERQQDSKNDSTKHGSTYRSIIEEEEFSVGSKNFLAILGEKLFMKGRKLRPLIKEQPSKNLELVKECKIVIHCIKGENVPIRHEVVNEYQALKNNDGQDGGRSRAHRPTANLPSNVGGDPNYNREDSMEDDRQQRQFKTKEQLDLMPQVETYVEIKVQYHKKYTIVKKTNIDEGTMPRWNEILDFPLVSDQADGFTQEELTSSKTMIIASLFDQQTYQSVREGERVFLEEHRFLGSVTIPLVTLLTNAGKTDFNFRLNRPICLPNYRVMSDEIYFMSAAELAKQKAMENEQPPTYINLSITVEPNIELPKDNTELNYPGHEKQKILDEGARWVYERQKACKFKNPNIALFGENIKGQSVLLCRYLTEQQPPLTVVDLEKQPLDSYAIEKVARFVSMIPYVEDLRMFQDMPDLFTTTQEFFDLGGGDYEEHAILLANYFSYIDKKQGRDYKSFIVFGNGMPNGEMVFVMRKKSITEGSFEIWDPLTAQCYYYGCTTQKKRVLGIACGESRQLMPRLTDAVCPMTQIHTIADSTNVWVNTQKSDYPILMDFNLNAKGKWKKFFTEEKVQETIQPIVQLAEPRQHTEVIEARIQKYLVEMFQDERIKKVRKTTKWAVTMNEALQNILLDCEEWAKMARHGGIHSDLIEPNRRSQNENLQIGTISSQLDELAKNETNRRVWGFPINCTFTSLENLWKLVQNTKLHAVNRQDVEFGLSVYIQAYPSNILSVWVYLAAFVDVSIENLYQQ